MLDENFYEIFRIQDSPILIDQEEWGLGGPLDQSEVIDEAQFSLIFLSLNFFFPPLHFPFLLVHFYDTNTKNVHR